MATTSAVLFLTCGEQYLLPTPMATHVAFLRYINRTIQSINQRFAHIFCSQDDDIKNVRIMREDDVGRKCQLDAQDCSLNDKSFGGDKKGQHAVFNVLDTMLKSSLERLKIMRENISMVKIGLHGYACEYNNAENEATIRFLCLEGKLVAALWLRRRMVQKGILPDVYTHNHIVNRLCKTGFMEKADCLFRHMLESGPRPNCATYNTLIKGYCALNSIEKALDLFSTMSNAGIQPNRVTYNILVHALLCEKGHLKKARKMREDILNDDNDEDKPDLVSSTIFMDDYFKNGESNRALGLWNELIQKCARVDVVSYNVLINGFCLNKQMNLAYGYACEMLKKGLIPDVFTYNILIGALCKEGRIIEASYILGVMSKMGIMPDQISYRMMIKGLRLNGDVVQAKDLLLRMLNNFMVQKPPKRIVWNLIIDFYGRCEDLRNALFTRNLMLAFGVLPNVFTYNALILAQLKSGNIHNALCLKEEMPAKGLHPDVVTYNLLIGGAYDFGRPELARQLYDEMLHRGCEPDLKTFTEFIKDYCIRGHVEDAEGLYARILKAGIVNDHVPVQILFNKYCKLREPVKAFLFYQDWLASKQDSNCS
ncbi:pentatricopeptide repeat-containing protein At5g24830 [Trifolium pratense]|uniref:pentatricopeptide repeat-containing protein At5g24830 n=1 Tax=Trifolium pratense TaxID=57577 RepID=UPI001E69336D|nr:pentatricopeptide repeat-containing protein At5g24830 [Trifolium pratense]XP_045821544.1 pentatricopeptide repeat-containing protein At5g24830 [Trifolium pratense]